MTQFDKRQSINLIKYVAQYEQLLMSQIASEMDCEDLVPFSALLLASRKQAERMSLGQKTKEGEQVLKEYIRFVDSIVSQS